MRLKQLPKLIKFRTFQKHFQARNSFQDRSSHHKAKSFKFFKLP